MQGHVDIRVSAGSSQVTGADLNRVVGNTPQLEAGLQAALKQSISDASIEPLPAEKGGGQGLGKG